jgi:Virulence factor
MANLIITYWRDIPSAVSVKIGRKEAIDMAAMRSGATESDAYLADWRRGEPEAVSDDMIAEVEKALTDLESHYSQDKIKTLIANGGKEL